VPVDADALNKPDEGRRQASVLAYLDSFAVQEAGL
jgi:hypothetical protein